MSVDTAFWSGFGLLTVFVLAVFFGVVFGTRGCKCEHHKEDKTHHA